MDGQAAGRGQGAGAPRPQLMQERSGSDDAADSPNGGAI